MFRVVRRRQRVHSRHRLRIGDQRQPAASSRCRLSNKSLRFDIGRGVDNVEAKSQIHFQLSTVIRVCGLVVWRTIAASTIVTISDSRPKKIYKSAAMALTSVTTSLSFTSPSLFRMSKAHLVSGATSLAIWGSSIVMFGSKIRVSVVKA